MNREQAAEYLANGGTACPYCKSFNIEADRFDHDIEGQVVRCNDCDKQWQDNYTLTGVGWYDDSGDSMEYIGYDKEDFA